jgi:hypothetical protein
MLHGGVAAGGQRLSPDGRCSRRALAIELELLVGCCRGSPACGAGRMLVGSRKMLALGAAARPSRAGWRGRFAAFSSRCRMGSRPDKTTNNNGRPQVSQPATGKAAVSNQRRWAVAQCVPPGGQYGAILRYCHVTACLLTPGGQRTVASPVVVHGRRAARRSLLTAHRLPCRARGRLDWALDPSGRGDLSWSGSSKRDRSTVCPSRCRRGCVKNQESAICHSGPVRINGRQEPRLNCFPLALMPRCLLQRPDPHADPSGPARCGPQSQRRPCCGPRAGITNPPRHSHHSPRPPCPGSAGPADNGRHATQ